MYKRILVPLDGSETARFGLREALTLAKQQKATVCLLHVTTDFPVMLEMSSLAEFEKVRAGLHQYGQELLQEAQRLAESLDVPAETKQRELQGGRVADVIVDEARQSACDLIAIGTHGRRGIRRALLGSDAEGVLRQSPVPVLLVRQPDSVVGA
ncbi:MAG TPA: universal stress protein [Albitalea sp.]|uniref:universal stress protein n=1 Tax=Piscinibacter sp. TaxID=1903157 RepID=UPI002ED69CDD